MSEKISLIPKSGGSEKNENPFNKREFFENKKFLSLELSDATIDFCSWNNFNPKLASETLPIPKSIENVLNDRYTNGNETYLNTIKEGNWQKGLFNFVDKYLSEKGVSIKNRLKIENLNELSPKKLCEVSIEIVSSVIKFDDEDLAARIGDSNHDQSTALQLLEEGLSHLENPDPDWNGNGVCRNFASLVKAVFNALKFSQKNPKFVANIYCLYLGGADYLPPDNAMNLVEDHAWNIFVSIEDGGRVKKSQVDVTWAVRNEELDELLELDHTCQRSEPLINNLALNNEISSVELNKILRYYIDLIKKEYVEFTVPRERIESAVAAGVFKENEVNALFVDYNSTCYLFKETEDDKFLKSEGFNALEKETRQLVWELFNSRKHLDYEKGYYLKRGLRIIEKVGVIDRLPEEFVGALAEMPGHFWGKNDLETIFMISQKNQHINISEFILNYADYNLEDVSGRKFFFESDLLQKKFYEILYEDTAVDFTKILRMPLARIRFREVLPENFLSFDPIHSDDDLRELLELAPSDWETSEFIKKIKTDKSVESLELFYSHIKKLLRKKLGDNYEYSVRGKSDYDVLKDFDKIYFSKIKNRE